MKRCKFHSAYYALFYKGSRIACYFNYCDLVEYVRRSVAGGCSADGWTVQLIDGSRRRLRCDVSVYADLW